MVQELAENPPADRLLALYFAARDWWSPPQMSFAGGTPDGDVWECPFPETTE